MDEDKLNLKPLPPLNLDQPRSPRSTDPPSVDLRPLVDNPPPPVKVPDDIPILTVEGLTPSPTPVTLASEPTITRKT